jgi:lycopene beta-cyclase
MNFKVPQKGNTRFMYVLPLGRNKALLEYTLFSQNVLERKEYKDAIADFLKELPTGGYEILEEEEGKIPMTCYRFDLKNNSKLLHIGTAGGWTKPSTGYTFQRINEKTKELVDFLKKGQPLSRFGKRTRFWFYDLLFIDVLAKDNANGAKLFKKMFEKNSPEVIFQFLDEKSTLWQEFQIMRSFDVGQFVKALLKRLF